MPELPEVETIVRGISRSLPKVPISRVVTGPFKKFKPHGIAKLAKSTIVKVSRRGKNIIIYLNSGKCLLIHLGMTGQLYWTELNHHADSHTHLRLEFAQSNRALHFRDVRRFGQLKLYPSIAELRTDKRIAKLGPEPLQISLPAFKKLLQRPRMIKALLLDQSVIVGFGNIYVDETLFAARLHPATPANQISPTAVAGLYRAMKGIFKQAIAAGGSSVRDFRHTDGQPGKFQTRHKVYRRTGKKCPRCQTPIQRLIIADRSSHICPACQPLDS